VPVKSFTPESPDDVAEGILALAQLIKYMPRAEDVPVTLTHQERLHRSAQLVKKLLPVGSFGYQAIDFVASPTQEDGKAKLSIVRSDGSARTA
jgi:hypothetical protein